MSSQVIQNSSTMTGIKPNSSPSVTDIHLKKRSQPGRPRPGDSWNKTRRCRPVASAPQEQRCPSRLGHSSLKTGQGEKGKHFTRVIFSRQGPLFSGLRPSPAESLRTRLEIQEPVQLLKIKFRLLKMLVWKEALVSIRETNSMASHPIGDPANHPHQ